MAEEKIKINVGELIGIKDDKIGTTKLHRQFIRLYK